MFLAIKKAFTATTTPFLSSDGISVVVVEGVEEVGDIGIGRLLLIFATPGSISLLILDVLYNAL